MTTKEAERLRLLKNHSDGIISLVDVSKLLGISYRQIKRVWKDFKKYGEKALISKKRKMRNRSFDPRIKEKILSLINTHYSDYGPTFLSEKLLEKHNIKVSKETVRKLMINCGLRKSKKQKKVKVYQRRKRRSCSGTVR